MKNIDLVEHQKSFLDSLDKSGKSFNTVKNYRTDLNCFNKFLAQKGQKTVINELTLTQVKEYCNYLDQIYNSPNSIRRRVQALRIFFDYLIANGVVESNPIKKAVVAAKVVELPTPPSFIVVQKLYQQFCNQTKSTKSLEHLLGLRNKVLFYLIYGSGLKVSDISNLKVSNILTGQNNEYRVLISHPKRDPYTIKLPEGFSNLFKQYSDQLEKQKKIDNLDFDNLLFNANPYRILAGGLSPRGIEILFKDLKSKLGAHITAKSLRQACIFKWLIQGAPQASIKEWMGVQPQYSLAPYVSELEKNKEIYTFIDIEEDE